MRLLPLLLFFALGASVTYGSPEVAKDARPNILFCLADDWSWPHAGAYGDPVVKTPAFDRLAREGLLFEHAYVSSPSCTPSRNALLTGQQFYRLGTGANLYGTLDSRHPNFMFLLREAGYSIGHWRKAWGPGKFQDGGYREHPCGPESSFAVFMQQRDKTKPFCFWFGTSDPHRSYEEGSGRKKGMDIDRVPVPGFYPKVDTIRSDIADYYFEVERWNHDVAQALDLLEKAGELDNTIVVMTGDNGMPFPRCKGNLYDSGIRNYMPARWPAGTPDHRNAYKENAWLGDCDNGPTKYYLWANRDLDDEHRRCHDLAFDKRPAEELYVLADDPDQLRNVAGNPEYADVKADLAARLTNYLQKTGDPRETGKPVKFDAYSYCGGLPTWPGDKAIRKYMSPPTP